jgi:hypothetical protein
MSRPKSSYSLFLPSQLNDQAPSIDPLFPLLAHMDYISIWLLSLKLVQIQYMIVSSTELLVFLLRDINSKLLLIWILIDIKSKWNCKTYSIQYKKVLNIFQDIDNVPDNKFCYKLTSKSESGPPGQYTQIFPVIAIWGHLCGLHMTATTAIPDAVLIGFALIFDSKSGLYSSGIAWMISTRVRDCFASYDCFTCQITFHTTCLILEYFSVWFFLKF